MFGFLIILACISGGLTFGVAMMIGAMFYSGKWTLPNSEQRKIQRATVRKEVARLESETAEFQRERQKIDARRDFESLQQRGLLLDFEHKLKQAELEAGPLPTEVAYLPKDLTDPSGGSGGSVGSGGSMGEIRYKEDKYG